MREDSSSLLVDQRPAHEAPAVVKIHVLRRKQLATLKYMQSSYSSSWLSLVGVNSHSPFMPVECCIDTQLGKYALDFLRIDTRPTFVVFVPDEFSANEKAVMLFANDALRSVEKRGELPTGWVLSEGFLRSGGGRCFPNSRWRFTAVTVGDSVVGGRIMVVTAEWGGDAWEHEFNRLRQERKREQDERISQPIKTNGTMGTQSTFREAQLPPASSLILSVSKPAFDQQLSVPAMDWTREDSPLYNSQHYRNLRSVDWYFDTL